MGFSETGLAFLQLIALWATNRMTIRVEDRAHSLMGLLGVNMPMLYGEGWKHFTVFSWRLFRCPTIKESLRGLPVSLTPSFWAMTSLAFV